MRIFLDVFFVGRVKNRGYMIKTMRFLSYTPCLYLLFC